MEKPIFPSDEDLSSDVPEGALDATPIIAWLVKRIQPFLRFATQFACGTEEHNAAADVSEAARRLVADAPDHASNLIAALVAGISRFAGHQPMAIERGSEPPSVETLRAQMEDPDAEAADDLPPSRKLAHAALQPFANSGHAQLGADELKAFIASLDDDKCREWLVAISAIMVVIAEGKEQQFFDDLQHGWVG